MTTATLHRPARTARAVPAATRLLPTILVLAPTALLATGQLYLGIPLVPAVAADWQATPAAALSALTTFGLGYATGVLVFGLLVDRLGARRVMTYGLLAAALATAAVTFAGDLTGAYVLRGVQGFAVGAFPPAAFAYIGATVPMARKGLVFSCLTGGFLAAGGLAQLAGQGVVAVTDWRTAFLGGAALMLAAAVAVRLVLRPDPVRTKDSAPARLKVTGRLTGLYAAAFTLLVGFVTVYTGLQLSGDVDPGSLPWLRLSAVPAVVVVPFLIGRSRMTPTRRAAIGLAVVAVVTAILAFVTAPTVVLAALLFVLTLAVATSAPSLAEAVGTESGPARAFGAGIFNACLLTGASVAGPVASTLDGRTTSILVAAAVTALGASAAFSAHRNHIRREHP
ncbi:MFS transporter [Phytomonospora endophytica]|uniref:MFS family permease n=1 Tax=Phytomonospora endophytica TaxID=714109 RepID=A0A841FX85_9ACTN|nr:MFS transporter [Phytomonospora endophytica]MBB6036580.1 MFS family permease [Phytomonospora endophytica]